MNTCCPTQPFGYNLLGGKFISLIAQEGVKIWEQKYNQKVAAILTTSLHGSKSQYSGMKYWKYLGTSSGKTLIKPFPAHYYFWRWWLQNNYPHIMDEIKHKPSPKQQALSQLYKILDIDKCHIQPKIGNKILEAVKKKCKENTNLKPYNPRTHIGFLRHLMIRYGFNTDQIMVNIVTAYEDIEKLEPIVKILKNDLPEVTTIINNINTKKADVSYGEYEILLHGNRTIEEKMNGLTFDISANSFFQTNTLQGEKLYDEVKKLCNLKGNEIIYDLYCGTGTIGLSLSQTAKHVYGFEIIRSSLENAQINATKNNVKNITFLKANLDTYFKSGQLPRELPKPNIIIVDPPRAGMHKDMVSFIPKMKPDSLIYVSCNPTTQARDSKILVKSGYHLENISVVDMFPHTPHIETVALFNKE